jgi:DNA-binding transcriptional LysR family regulator
LVKSGAGYGLLPARVAALEGSKELSRVNGSLPEFKDKIALVYRADLGRTAAAKYLVREIQDSRFE